MATTNFTFLKNRFNEQDSLIYAIGENRIETLKTHETYDSYGQQVGHYNAGDYSVLNSACDLKRQCEIAVAENFYLDLDEIELYDLEIDYSGEEMINEEEINKFIEEYEAENAIYYEVEGFNFWNGHNWQTVVTSDEFSEPGYDVISDEELIDNLNKAIEVSELVAEKTGKRIYQGNGYFVISNSYSDSFASYELISETGVELSDL